MTKRRKRYSELKALKIRIKECDTSYTKVSEEIGLTPQSFSNKMNGFACFTSKEIEDIGEILQISPKDLAKYFLPNYADEYMDYNSLEDTKDDARLRNINIGFKELSKDSKQLFYDFYKLLQKRSE